MEEEMELGPLERAEEEPRPEEDRAVGPVVAIDDEDEPNARYSDSEDGSAHKKIRLEAPEDEKKVEKDEEDEQDLETSRTCPICMDTWSNAGEHRLCSLRCGHLFGRSCVLRWIQVGCTAGNRRCPQCNKKASVKDIRILYARKLSVVDTAEMEKLKKDLQAALADKSALEIEVAKSRLRQKLYEQRFDSLSSRIKELENERTDARLNQSVSKRCGKFHLEKTLEISKDGGCRVLDYNQWRSWVVVSQKFTNSLFSGYGVRKINVQLFQTEQYLLLHNQVIRDVAFHPSEQALLLSVSFDRTVKIVDMRNNVIVHGYPVDYPLWSGCWSTENSNILLVGAQNGSIFEFDVRQTSGALAVHETPGDRSPVVSMASVPANSSAGLIRGGFIASHLNTCYAYEVKDITQWRPRQMFLDGPFVSVRYDENNSHCLLSSRPNSNNPNARHTVFTMEKDNDSDNNMLCNVIHTFNGGNSQKFMSRSCQINIGTETLIAAHQESTSSIPFWSVSTGREMYTMPISDPVLDMRSFHLNDKIFFATLSETKLRLYNYD